MIRIEQRLEQLRRVMNEVSAEKGEFILFGYFLREDASRWDLVLSAHWLEEEGLREAFRVFFAKLTPLIGKQQLFSFNIAPVKPADPRLKALLKEVQVENGLVELQDVTLFDMDMRRVYILQAKRPAKQPARQLPAKRPPATTAKAAGKLRPAKRSEPKSPRASRAR